mmetsp:Transcript_39783/g.55246  ORF Transcript_39783/g.55246 Transcript_39783/m.55246 type:complete len:201 (+) Transcript_39783:152-754(+)
MFVTSIKQQTDSFLYLLVSCPPITLFSKKYTFDLYVSDALPVRMATLACTSSWACAAAVLVVVSIWRKRLEVMQLSTLQRCKGSLASSFMIIRATFWSSRASCRRCSSSLMASWATTSSLDMVSGKSLSSVKSSNMSTPRLHMSEAGCLTTLCSPRTTARITSGAQYLRVYCIGTSSPILQQVAISMSFHISSAENFTIF